MKIKRFFAIIVALCLFLTGCSKSVDWDKDIQKLENAGYTVTYHTSEEELASITHELNSWAKFNGYDLTFEVEKYTDLLKDNDGPHFESFELPIIKNPTTNKAEVDKKALINEG